MDIPRNDMRQAMHNTAPVCPESKALGAIPYICRKDMQKCQCSYPQKPVVHYTPTSSDFIALGRDACIKTTDHPGCSNLKFVITTQVVDYDVDTGEFETMNTLYKPVK